MPQSVPLTKNVDVLTFLACIARDSAYPAYFARGAMENSSVTDSQQHNASSSQSSSNTTEQNVGLRARNFRFFEDASSLGFYNGFSCIVPAYFQNIYALR